VHKILEKLWPPVFLNKLTDAEGIEDGQALFGCRVNSKPAPVFTWSVYLSVFKIYDLLHVSFWMSFYDIEYKGFSLCDEIKNTKEWMVQP